MRHLLRFVKPLEIERKQIAHVGIQLTKSQDTLEGTTYAHGLAEKKAEMARKPLRRDVERGSLYFPL